MSRPGVEIRSGAAAPAAGVPTDTSVGFMVGEASQGPTDSATRLVTSDDFTRVYGGRLNANPVIADSVDAFFRVGGGVLYFMRATDGADVAEDDLNDATLSAASAGTWGNDLSLQLVTTPGGQSGSFMGTVKRGGTAVQVSQPMATEGELATWLATGSYLRLSGYDPSEPLAAGTTTLSGGTDGTVPVGAQALGDAADIPSDLGPGQLFAPGRSDTSEHQALLDAAAESDRVCILDGAVTDGPLELESKATALRQSENDRYGSLWGPWATIPGLAPGTTRVVPWSPIQAALCARVDAAGNPNQAAAGNWGIPEYVTGLVQNFSPADCERLLYAGVCTARDVYGAVQAYAYRTLVDPTGPRQEWREFNWARLDMAIKAQAKSRGQSYVFAQLDGRGHTIAAFGGALTGILIDYFNRDALYGDEPTKAFSVNVGPAVNTTEKLSDGILSAVMQTRMSPHAELVQIVAVKVPITITLV